MKTLVVLDNEAVQALGSVVHPKYQRIMDLVQVVVQRKRRAVDVALVVPTTVRVEAGWDRTAAAWAMANRLRVADEALSPARGKCSSPDPGDFSCFCGRCPSRRGAPSERGGEPDRPNQRPDRHRRRRR